MATPAEDVRNLTRKGSQFFKTARQKLIDNLGVNTWRELIALLGVIALFIVAIYFFLDAEIHSYVPYFPGKMTAKNPLRLSNVADTQGLMILGNSAQIVVEFTTDHLAFRRFLRQQDSDWVKQPRKDTGIETTFDITLMGPGDTLMVPNENARTNIWWTDNDSAMSVFLIGDGADNAYCMAQDAVVSHAVRRCAVTEKICGGGIAKCDGSVAGSNTCRPTAEVTMGFGKCNGGDDKDKACTNKIECCPSGISPCSHDCDFFPEDGGREDGKYFAPSGDAFNWWHDDDDADYSDEDVEAFVGDDYAAYNSAGRRLEAQLVDVEPGGTCQNDEDCAWFDYYNRFVFRSQDLNITEDHFGCKDQLCATFCVDRDDKGALPCGLLPDATGIVRGNSCVDATEKGNMKCTCNDGWKREEGHISDNCNQATTCFDHYIECQTASLVGGACAASMCTKTGYSLVSFDGADEDRKGDECRCRKSCLPHEPDKHGKRIHEFLGRLELREQDKDTICLSPWHDIDGRENTCNDEPQWGQQCARDMFPPNGMLSTRPLDAHQGRFNDDTIRGRGFIKRDSQAYMFDPWTANWYQPYSSCRIAGLKDKTKYYLVMISEDPWNWAMSIGNFTSMGAMMTPLPWARDYSFAASMQWSGSHFKLLYHLLLYLGFLGFSYLLYSERIPELSTRWDQLLDMVNLPTDGTLTRQRTYCLLSGIALTFIGVFAFLWQIADKPAHVPWNKECTVALIWHFIVPSILLGMLIIFRRHDYGEDGMRVAYLYQRNWTKYKIETCGLILMLMCWQSFWIGPLLILSSAMYCKDNMTARLGLTATPGPVPPAPSGVADFIARTDQSLPVKRFQKMPVLTSVKTSAYPY